MHPEIEHRPDWLSITNESQALFHLLWSINCTDPNTFKQLVAESRNFETRFPAWQDVRKNRAQQVIPISNLPHIGSEGYYVGLSWSPEAILLDEVKRGQEMLDIIAHDHRNDWEKRNQILRSLYGKDYNIEALWEIDAVFSAQLARLRALILNVRDPNNPRYAQEAKNKYELFRRETYERVQHLPAVTYVLKDGVVEFTYCIPPPEQRQEESQLAGSLTTKQKEAYNAFENSGRITLPIIRAALRHG